MKAILNSVKLYTRLTSFLTWLSVRKKRKKKKVWGGGEEPESYVDTECSGTFIWGVQYFKKWPSSEGWGRGNVWHLTSFVSVDIFLLMQRSTEPVLIGCWITREFTPSHLSVSQLFIPRPVRSTAAGWRGTFICLIESVSMQTWIKSVLGVPIVCRFSILLSFMLYDM